MVKIELDPKFPSGTIFTCRSSTIEGLTGTILARCFEPRPDFLG